MDLKIKTVDGAGRQMNREEGQCVEESVVKDTSFTLLSWCLLVLIRDSIAKCLQLYKITLGNILSSKIMKFIKLSHCYCKFTDVQLSAAQLWGSSRMVGIA